LVSLDINIFPLSKKKRDGEDHGALDTSECSADREDDERDIVLLSSHYGVVDWWWTG
jgi:hypothetical protein